MAGHDHGHASSGSRHARPLAIVFGLTLTYLIAEVVGAYLANSLALLADAAHMATDVAGLGLALFAIWFARKPAHPGKSYGYYRIEILAALLNGALLLAVGAYVVVEAWRRFQEPPEVDGPLMLVIAGIGLLVNLIGLFLLRDGASESLNVQGAFLEVMADALGSIGVMVAGLIVWLTGWVYADPLFSLAIGLLIVPRTIRLMIRTVNVLMEGAPDDLDVRELERQVKEVDGVDDIHDLHVWTISSGIPSLSMHVVARPDQDRDQVLDRVIALLRDEFGIEHSTIQIEGSRREEHFYHESNVEADEGQVVSSGEGI